MSENTETDESGEQYILAHKNFRRTPGASPSGEAEVYERGDPIEPTDRELELHPEKFLRVNEDGFLLDDVQVDRPLTPEEEAALAYRRNHANGDGGSA
ncbi:hypothetical protein SAMN05421858_5135 [Haladaptatus litoreus]|uniref:Uncharacterized protein n=1 Tax=Haladaptatus litoreus TaxID=553468 RepID=A0A1N7FKE0_9EURY|nr:hypothetical protein [Haladaptatus litoreus]SIS00771.1 hypothetical protein SAMN05421858_5135 [Haladaptatus litoreus]